MTDHNLKLWGIGTSRTMRAHWALQEIGVPYDCEPILPRTGETKTAQFTAINPRQKIPVLQDGDFALAESAAIVTYLGEHHDQRENGLVPKAAAERARYNEWCFFIMTELDATAIYVIRRHGDLTEIYGKSDVAVACAKEYFLRMAASIEQALSDGRSHLLGECFTGADILLTTCLYIAERYEIAVPAALTAYRDLNADRDSYRRARAINNPESLGKV